VGEKNERTNAGEKNERRIYRSGRLCEAVFSAL
jgi:hypothetical protein